MCVCACAPFFLLGEFSGELGSLTLTEVYIWVDRVMGFLGVYRERERERRQRHGT